MFEEAFIEGYVVGLVTYTTSYHIGVQGNIKYSLQNDQHCSFITSYK